jgi:hypothetical protein
MLKPFERGDVYEGICAEEFAAINKAANEYGLMAYVIRIDHDEDEIDFVLIKQKLQ